MRADVNIDSELVSGKVHFGGGEQLVSLSNGCICCSIREDLMREVGPELPFVDCVSSSGGEFTVSASSTGARPG